MSKLLLAPITVIVCVLLGVVAGAIYFGAVIAIVDWLSGSLAFSDATGQRIGYNASFPAFALGAPAGALIGLGLCSRRFGSDNSSRGGIIIHTLSAVSAVVLATVCTILPVYHAFLPAMAALLGRTGTATIVGLGSTVAFAIAVHALARRIEARPLKILAPKSSSGEVL